MGVRHGLKRTVERLLVGSGTAGAVIRYRARDVAILSYHNIVPTGEPAAGDRSLHLAQATFGEQLDRLLESHEIVRLDDILCAPGGDRPARPSAAITFDDGYLGAMTAGRQELERRGIPATVFVNPGALHWEGFWWDRLANPVSGLLPAGVRQKALGPLGGRQDLVLEWAANEGLPIHSVPAYARPAPAEHLVAVAASGTMSLGSHSWSHASLPSLGPADLAEELDRARAWLASHLPGHSSWMSFPYGHTSEAVARAAAQRHAGGLLLSERLATPEALTKDPMGVPRVNIPSSASPEGFVLRLAGIG